MSKINLDAFFYCLQKNYDHLPVKRIDLQTFKIGTKTIRLTHNLIYYNKQVIKYSGRPTGLIVKIWELGICRPYIGFYFSKLYEIENKCKIDTKKKV
jgi:hypothetical protein